jgi:hypothetical protein
VSVLVEIWPQNVVLVDSPAQVVTTRLCTVLGGKPPTKMSVLKPCELFEEFDFVCERKKERVQAGDSSVKRKCVDFHLTCKKLIKCLII